MEVLLIVLFKASINMNNPVQGGESLSSESPPLLVSLRGSCCGQMQECSLLSQGQWVKNLFLPPSFKTMLVLKQQVSSHLALIGKPYSAFPPRSRRSPPSPFSAGALVGLWKLIPSARWCRQKPHWARARWPSASWPTFCVLWLAIKPKIYTSYSLLLEFGPMSSLLIRLLCCTPL